MIALTINGETRRFQAPLKVDALLGELELAGKRIALERNGEIVPRSRFGDEWLADGDRLEVTAGLSAGDRVVVSPPDTLADGMPVVVR